MARLTPRAARGARATSVALLVVSALAVGAASGPAVAADTGSDAAATSFTVNGTICAT